MRIILARLALVTALGVLPPSTVVAFVPSSSQPTTTTTTQLNAAALIIQNKGGGHGELGYQLAKTLQSNSDNDIDSVTILQDDAAKMDAQEPFKSYATDLPDVKIVPAPLSSADESFTKETLQSILGDGVRFDYVWDNASKKPEGAGKACADLAKDWGVQLYTYVSSAGMYTPDASTVFPMDEATTPIKSTAGQALFDQYCVDQGLPLVSFRPQYIYGEKANKFDYM